MKLFSWVLFFHLLLFAFFPSSTPKPLPKKKLTLSFHTPKELSISKEEGKSIDAKQCIKESQKIEEPLVVRPLVKEAEKKSLEKKAVDSSPKQIKEPQKIKETAKAVKSVKAPTKEQPKNKEIAKNIAKPPAKKNPNSPPKNQKKSNAQIAKEIARNKEIAAIRSQLNETNNSLSLDLPKNLTLASDRVEEESFCSILVIFLQENLHMPYPDKISVTLTLSSDGKCLKVAISQCKYQENRSYLEKKLPLLTYPSFSQKKIQKSFSLLFDVD